MQDRAHAEERFAKAFRSSPNPIAIVLLADGCFVDVNTSFLNTSGYNCTLMTSSLLHQLATLIAIVRTKETTIKHHN